MKPKPCFEPHLIVKELTLLPGAEHVFRLPGWYFLLAERGVGYWLHPRANYELVSGSVLVFGDRTGGSVRASQVAPLTVRVFRLQPDRLTGLLTWGEQQFLQDSARQEAFGMRWFAGNSKVSERFKQLCQRGSSSSLRQRVEMLELFAEVFGAEIHKHQQAPQTLLDAKTRLTKLLNETPPSGLLDWTFADLQRETRCTPRHLSRIFHQVVGMSFREKQTQLRLLRAQELLATTDSKVLEIALESGYQSPGLFNLIFKRQFGVTPARWRDERRGLKTGALDRRTGAVKF